MVKEKASYDESTARQMAERVINFLGAMKKPTTRIGEKRSQRKPNPDFVAPEAIEVERFEQRNREDRWSKTVYGGDHRDGIAKITVQDPMDPDDIVLDPITPDDPNKHRVDGLVEREVHPEKISQLQVEDDEGTEVPK
jgi:hypothetical protein